MKNARTAVSSEPSTPPARCANASRWAMVGALPRSPPCSSSVICGNDYCFLYGLPSAAGGTVRPITPATAIRVSTYGSAWKSVAAEPE